MTDDGKSFDKIWDDGFAEVQKKNDVAKLAQEQKRAADQAEFERGIQWLRTNLIPLLEEAAAAGAKHGVELIKESNFERSRFSPEIKFHFKSANTRSTKIRVYVSSNSYGASEETGGNREVLDGFSVAENLDGDPRPNLSTLIKNAMNDLMKKLTR